MDFFPLLICPVVSYHFSWAQKESSVTIEFLFSDEPPMEPGYSEFHVGNEADEPTLSDFYLRGMGTIAIILLFMITPQVTSPPASDWHAGYGSEHGCMRLGDYLRTHRGARVIIFAKKSEAA
jgi:hypothetical protein